jgi:hypothetical protein
MEIIWKWIPVKERQQLSDPYYETLPLYAGENSNCLKDARIPDIAPDDITLMHIYPAFVK